MAVYFLPKSRVKKFSERTDLPADLMIINVSSRASDGWNVLSPFYDHGGIPVPGMDGKVSRTVEGIWQGLKRFENVGEDLAMLETGRPKKRRMSKDTGKIVGHVYRGETVRGAVEARKLIYIPAYRWMIENCPKAKAKFEELVALSETRTLHLYDFEENGDVNDARPYAHAALLVELVKEARKPASV